uniref:Putative secreted protein n=1 Tax=Anopheles marajoara TaxID=58244 RepID=A0A2M4CD12_9DIPT
MRYQRMQRNAAAAAATVMIRMVIASNCSPTNSPDGRFQCTPLQTDLVSRDCNGPAASSEHQVCVYRGGLAHGQP